ncbi:peripherin [Kryptolebias marmoratus]|uniref:Peripherin-like n=1 Tax=Kryptolebias marmoratus TaxID=37003 RepID=A0A3Q2ZBG4_KRYMA|nr:peripherin [Kryptolebias marmoratus]
MAVLRVSSYRKMFEDDRWGGNGGSSVPFAGQYRASVRGAGFDRCGCEQLNFEAAEALNKEGLRRFVQERTAIAALNDRLVKLIELAHCYEEENEYLEHQIAEKLSSKPVSSSVTSAAEIPDYSLDAVVEKLRKQKDEILHDKEELKEELERLLKDYETAAHQRLLIQQDQQDVSEEVDAVTAECLALREQVGVYEEQLANMEAQHKTEAESLLKPDERTLNAAVMRFGSPDITPALDVKEYYCQLAESLQFECSASSSAVARKGDGKKLEVGGASGSKVKDLPEINDVREMKTLISELQKELAELEKCNEELEGEVEMKMAAYVDEVEELECTIDEIKQQEVDLEAQMEEQCEENKKLLNQKMARDMEIAAYRSLVEEEERLCSL